MKRKLIGFVLNAFPNYGLRARSIFSCIPTFRASLPEKCWRIRSSMPFATVGCGCFRTTLIGALDWSEQIRLVCVRAFPGRFARHGTLQRGRLAVPARKETWCVRGRGRGKADCADCA